MLVVVIVKDSTVCCVFKINRPLELPKLNQIATAGSSVS